MQLAPQGRIIFQPQEIDEHVEQVGAAKAARSIRGQTIAQARHAYTYTYRMPLRMLFYLLCHCRYFQIRENRDRACHAHRAGGNR